MRGSRFVELRELRCFVALAEERNFTRAAARLHLSQQAMSATVARLERRAGQQLVLRRPRGCSLTPAGLALLGPARALITDADRLTAAVRDFPSVPREGVIAGALAGLSRTKSTGTLLLGVAPGGAPRGLPALAAGLKDLGRTQQRNVAVTETSPHGGVLAVATGEVDVAVVYGPQPDDDRVHLRPIASEQRVAIVPARSPLADAHELAASDLLEQPLAGRHPDMSEAWEGFWTLRQERGEDARRLGQAAKSFHEVLWNVAVRDVVLTAPATVVEQFPAHQFGVAYVPAPQLPLVHYYMATPTAGAMEPEATAVGAPR